MVGKGLTLTTHEEQLKEAETMYCSIAPSINRLYPDFQAEH